MKIFKSDFILILREASLFVFFLSLIFLFDKSSNVHLIVGLLLLLLTYTYINSRVVEISISQKEVCIVEWRLLKIKKVYIKSNINISYKHEIVGRFIKQKVLRIYYNDHLIAKLKPSFSGWSKDSINSIYSTLSAISVPSVPSVSPAKDTDGKGLGKPH